jgi:signal peptidase I
MSVMEEPVPEPPAPPVPPESDESAGPDRATRLAQRRTRGRRQVIEWVVLLGAALVIALVVKTFLFQAFYIPSESMVPTLKVHDRVLVNKLSYRMHPVHRGDIVVFTKPKRELSNIKDLVKRVIALPNETVEGRDGHVYVDGRVLDEPYLPKGIQTRTFKPQKVPANAVWVMGDNRQFSEDSIVFGPILKSSIVGRVFVRIWPLNRLGFL